MSMPGISRAQRRPLGAREVFSTRRIVFGVGSCIVASSRRLNMDDSVRDLWRTRPPIARVEEADAFHPFPPLRRVSLVPKPIEHFQRRWLVLRQASSEGETIEVV